MAKCVADKSCAKAPPKPPPPPPHPSPPPTPGPAPPHPSPPAPSPAPAVVPAEVPRLNARQGTLVLGISLFCWGVWPSLRQLCGAPIAAFATLNICAQFTTACLYYVLVGRLSLGTNTLAMDLLHHGGPGMREVAVFAGGFLLGHADQLSALAMGHISASIAYPLYAGTALVLAQALNYLQLGSPQPFILLGGLALVALGLISLTVTQSLKARDEATMHKDLYTAQAALLAQLRPYSGPRSADAGCRCCYRRRGDDRSREYARDRLSIQGVPASHGANANALNPLVLLKPKKLSSGTAMLLCGLAGVAGAGWSPLSTFARRPAVSVGAGGASHGGVGSGGSAASVASEIAMLDTAICLVVFQAGQLFAVPSITNLGGWLTGTGVVQPLCALTCRATFYGVLCGVGVCTGYIAYFTSTAAHVPATVAFGIVACNPLLAMLLDILRCEYYGASCTIKLLLLTSMGCYFAAICVLAQIDGGSESDASGSGSTSS